MAVPTGKSLRLLQRFGTALGAVVLSTFAVAGVSHAAGTVYAALGDSYSSGTGAGSYGSSGSCYRSAKAYSQLWANAHSGTSFSFLACSGAKTGDVINQANSIPSGTNLVTVTVGGNDAGFTDVITTCTLNSDSACVNRVNTAKTYVNNTLPALLTNTYNAIKAKAPGARLVVLSYPRFYTVPGSCWVGLSDTKRSAINSGADTLASVIQQRAAAAGATFVDVRPSFAGHNICSSADDYLHSLTWPVVESYHPTVAGQSGGYYAPLRAAIG
ncbi:SGNH/GDSL hydrolase family protein [Amycolatopsis sp. OK19-0408]|uniref:SGNH/GDSL hydrolase family protein n=1 Tax=Amycolatopsis iheyensis TaxID=2945988 RepID=A0A9X2SIW2_9PSEU|nr:SGNH/GDSL hydrolase family protein [Amycolatopsis iheyensis]MCR6481660.1 SGNH/GDSL hydrolase family protein [Amycolatopsis iheyensis]